MSMWDKILPHRYLINHALRTASDELREYVDSYRAEHDRAIQRCHAEIEAAKVEKDQQFEVLKQTYQDKLAQDRDALGALQASFINYADAYMSRQLYFLQREKITLELKLLDEYSDFLTRQMKLIGEEITILEHRQTSLALQARIDDIVALINISGSNLICDNSDDPNTLLKKINSILSGSDCIDLLPVTKAAMFRLRKLLQERAEFLPVIQYISWLIQQKKNFSRELSNERREINEAKQPLKSQLASVKAELSLLTETLLNKATSIRNIWAVPMADIYISLSNTDKALSYNYRQIESIQSEINYMKEIRSDDSDRWEMLWDEKNSLSEEIPQLKHNRKTMYEQLQVWRDRRNAIMDLFKRNEIFLLSAQKGKVSDEVQILELKRLESSEELQWVDQRLEENKSQILCRCHQQKIVASEKIRDAMQKTAEKRTELAVAKSQVKRLQAQDKRFFVLRLFSESNDVINAKKRLDIAAKNHAQAEQKLIALQNELSSINDACERQISELIASCNREKNKLQTNISDIDSAIEFIQRRKGSSIK